MSGSEIEWSPPRTTGIAPAATTCATVRSIAAWLPTGSAGTTGASPKSTTRELREAVDPRLEMRPRRAAGGADRARAEAGAGPVGGEIVDGRPDDRDVDARELGGVVRVRHPAEGEEAGVVGLVGETELLPALERVDHAAILCRPLLRSPATRLHRP